MNTFDMKAFEAAYLNLKSSTDVVEDEVSMDEFVLLLAQSNKKADEDAFDNALNATGLR